jgi:hypothetical protein
MGKVEKHPPPPKLADDTLTVVHIKNFRLVFSVSDLVTTWL